MALSAFAMQMVPFAAFGQSSRFDKTTMETDPPSYPNPGVDVEKSKIAPDLEVKTTELSYGSRADERQKVIIQLKSETDINEMSGNDLSAAERKALIAKEVENNIEKTGILVTDLVSINGNVKKSFNRVGLVSAELPLSKIRQLAESNAVAYISPDSETIALGHVETTTGANLVRNLTSGIRWMDGALVLRSSTVRITLTASFLGKPMAR